MFTLLKSNLAFNRTVGHPLDKGVRFASSADDLIAIEAGCAKAVIITRGLSEQIQQELQTIRPLIAQGMHFHRGPMVKSYKDKLDWTGQYIPASSPFKKCAHMHEDMAHLLNAFRKATGQTEAMTAGSGVHLTTLNMDTKTEAEFRDTLDPTKIGHTRPHTDRRVDRLLCVYSQAARTGVSWIPGTFSFEEEKALQDVYMHSTNPDFVLNSLQSQTLGAGDVLVIKGTLEGRGRDQLLMHKFTRPQAAPSIYARLQKVY